MIGRLTRNAEVKYTNSSNGEQMAIARYTLAVDRKGKKQEGQPTADFISCVAFGKNGEFAEKYLKQGMKIAVSGRIQTGSYKNKEGQTVYTTDVVVEEQEFCEKKGESGNTQEEPPAAPEFLEVPEGAINDLPFK